jgi:hypothetical protein
MPDDDQDQPATRRDIREALSNYATREYVAEREKDILKWVVQVSLTFLGIQLGALLAIAGLILGGVYFIITHVHVTAP